MFRRKLCKPIFLSVIACPRESLHLVSKFDAHDRLLVHEHVLWCFQALWGNFAPDNWSLTLNLLVGLCLRPPLGQVLVPIKGEKEQERRNESTKTEMRDFHRFFFSTIFSYLIVVLDGLGNLLSTCKQA